MRRQVPGDRECCTGAGRWSEVAGNAREFYGRCVAVFGGSSRLAHEGHSGSVDGIFRVERTVCRCLMSGNSAAKIGTPQEEFHGETAEAWLKRLQHDEFGLQPGCTIIPKGDLR